MVSPKKPIAVFYEHPDWFRPLFAQFEQRGTSFVRVQPGEHFFDIGTPDGGFSLLFNRMSPSAWTRGHARSIFYTLNYVAALERAGVRVVNGARAFTSEISKSLQLALMRQLGLPYPRTRVIHDASAAPAAAQGLRFPVVVKPNIGGSGAGVHRFDTPAALAEAAQKDQLDFGLDHTALVQEFIPARGGYITRVEVLGGKYLYAIEVYFSGESFNLCPGDICSTTGGVELARAICPADAPRNNMKVAVTHPPAKVIAAVERIMHAAGIEVGGVEFIVDDRDGQPYYYDVNALSNFVADGERVLGFNPYARLAEFLEREAC